MLESIANSLGLWGVLAVCMIAMLVLYGAAELVKHIGGKPGQASEKAEVHVTVTGKRAQGRNYYATFQYENGDRRELTLPGEDYGMIAEGDTGLLTTDGDKFADFHRDRT